MIETLERVIRETEQEKLKKVKIQNKVQEQSFQVAFCGHFSAGKSTVLNQLMENELLPTSPIPTSANIIRIQNSSLGLTVQNKEGVEQKWDGEIPWEQVRNFGMNGIDIHSITISAPLPFLNERSMIFDTPGVDSTDPTHQEVTMEALQETDLIVYVMEYNHVQSETNLNFLKQLTEENKPIYIIINQIDKHDEHELSFKHFDHSARETLKNWGIHYLKLAYTSMKAHDHPLNEWSEVDKDIKTLLYFSKDLVPLANKRLLQAFYLRLMLRLEDDRNEAIQEIKDKMLDSGLNPNDIREREELLNKLSDLDEAKARLEQSFTKQWNDLVKNVTLFPYTTTELTRQWLEAMEPSYRVGWLFSKKKTNQARQERLQRLKNELEDKIQSLIVFHLQALFRSYDLNHLTNRQEVETAIEKLTISLDFDFFTHSVQQGPKNRDYVFTYTKERAKEIVSRIKRQAIHVLELIQIGMVNYWDHERNRVSERMNELRVVEQYVDEMNERKKRYDDVIAEYAHEASQYKDENKYESTLTRTMERSLPTFDQHEWGEMTLPNESVIGVVEQEGNDELNDHFDEKEAVKWLKELKSHFQNAGHPAVTEERKEILKRIKRFENRTFTISLFGAFSAGKSSFANALLGDHVLPVSPNPTTATVNVVKQSNHEHESGTALIEMKSEQTIRKEIELVSKQLEVDVSYETIQKWDHTKYTATSKWQKTYHAYLAMVKTGLNEQEDFLLDESYSVPLNDVSPFIAKEERACLVQKVTIFYDCELTKNGVVLVDTPGVNSIHGRHTQVAFKQVQQSDAIFYVSYYNHSFSKADQLFLQQMAKVNDGFREDKLYFILNASDLASSESELNGVRNHVIQQLKNNGISEPRLFALSSKKGLSGKQSNEPDDAFQNFERTFYASTINDILKLSYMLIVDEIKKYKEILIESIDLIQSENDKKEEKEKELHAKLKLWKEEVSNTSYDVISQLSKQELQQLFVYLRERIRFQLNDNYQDIVNVTTVTGDNKRTQKLTLRSALVEWLNEGDHFIKQELQATFVRIDAKVQLSVNEWVDLLMARIQKDFQSLNRPVEDMHHFQIDIRSRRFLQIEIDRYIQQFHSLRRFLEEGENRRWKEELVTKGTEHVQEQLKACEDETIIHLHSFIDQYVANIKEQFYDKLQRQSDRFYSLMNDTQLDILFMEKKKVNQFIKDGVSQLEND
ncbi:dynamin family protein [Halalkalibacter sp. APA_J-10(15)]|uniref:dynamin family protein n=1 Tax=Halalkalibacter sp. APA_J-10(15) TaxID=2933805 RepID=UPI001FF1720F|nr:dynamin family protein [Halalkalibacter sp. APA_J-10(15)]MCK0472076.1 dynamin family protein [Halalkalibacter sp. APA_J-10(15)]